MAINQHTDETPTYRSLPFVRTLKPKGTGRNFWAVKSTGDYDADAALGADYAARYIQHIKTGGTLPLYWIIEAMGKAGNDTRTVKISFSSAIDKYMQIAVHLRLSN